MGPDPFPETGEAAPGKFHVVKPVFVLGVVEVNAVVTGDEQAFEVDAEKLLTGKLLTNTASVSGILGQPKV